MYKILEEYDTNIMRRFRCLNKACRQSGWASKLIAITIRMYTKQRYYPFKTTRYTDNFRSLPSDRQSFWILLRALVSLQPTSYHMTS